MRIFVVGSGAREHALCWKLAQEADVYCAPGNPGIAEIVECVDIPATDFPGLITYAREVEIDLVVIGPENPLVAGLADAFREQGFAVFGPGKVAAQLEGSKSFSKALMRRAGVPTAEYQSFFDATACKEYCRAKFAEGQRVVVKASGVALGKGVIVCDDFEGTSTGIDELVALGESARTLIVETRLEGQEFSLLTLVSDNGYLSLPIAQDYKRIFDNDQGPNTGGMGAYSPVGWVSPDLVKQTEQQVVEPILNALKEDGIQYRGVLFTGMMGAQCLEFNVRFGDPEIETLVHRIGAGFAQALNDCAHGNPISPIEVRYNFAQTVMIASGGYPGDYAKGKPIVIPPMPPNVQVFHAGTARHEGQLVTAGGRVLAVSAHGPSANEAREAAYQAVKQISFEGAQYRSDIGA